MSNSTAERLDHHSLSNNYVFQRSLLAYVQASKMVGGRVLEIGTGMGYGVEYIAHKADHFLTVDKFKSSLDTSVFKNVEFRQCNVPPLTGIPDDSFDFVISFQVIEHIQNDNLFLQEIQRVLKKGGKCIITTPNKPMSLTRNPWHIREYYIDELKNLMLRYFTKVEPQGVFGNNKVMDYYEKNKASVKRITRWDILNLQYRLPRWMLQIPFDVANKLNRKKLLEENPDLTSSITMDDYRIDQAKEDCFDLFFVGEKG